MDKKTSTFLIILLCILVAVAGDSVSYAYLNKAHEDETQALESQIDTLDTNIAKLKFEAKKAETAATQTTPTTAATTTTDPTANWKTYTDDTSGITIKYPTSYGISSTKTEGSLIATTGIGSKVISFSDNSLAKMSYSRYNNESERFDAGELNYITSSTPNCSTCKSITSNSGLQIKYNKVIANDFGKNGSYLIGYVPLKKNNLKVFTVYWEINGIGEIPSNTETEFENILKSAITVN